MTAKGDYKRMFNQYTVVQDFETLRLAYEEIIQNYNDEVNDRFNYRNTSNKKSFFVVYSSDVSSDGEIINLEDVDIPVGVEFDSASGELKPVGSYVKPQKAID